MGWCSNIVLFILIDNQIYIDKFGYVLGEAEYYNWSSAMDYAGDKGFVDIELLE